MRALVTAAVVLLCAPTACAGGGDSSELVVSAASSLTGAFEELAMLFGAENPDVEVSLNFDSSAALATQVEAGAPLDVFASADASNMARVVDSGAAANEPVRFAGNDMVIVTRSGNPHGVSSPSELERVVAAGEVVALCAESAPCGRLAAEVLAAGGVPAGLDESRVTRAPNARSTLGAVTRGDAAAGIVYRTDALAAGPSVEMVDPSSGPVVSTDYLAVVLSGGPGERWAAEAFVELLTSNAGRAVLEAEGFR